MTRKILLGIGGATAALGMSLPAQAAITFNISPPSGTFMSSDIKCDEVGPGCAGNFTQTASFARPSSNWSTVAATISNIANGPGTNIDFTSVTLNGVNFDLSPTGAAEFGSLSPIALMDTNTLVVRGVTSGAASFAGTLSFDVAAVPEPATWALMLLGFGGVGLVLRRRKQTSVTARLQTA